MNLKPWRSRREDVACQDDAKRREISLLLLWHSVLEVRKY